MTMPALAVASVSLGVAGMGLHKLTHNGSTCECDADTKLVVITSTLFGVVFAITAMHKYL